VASAGEITVLLTAMKGGDPNAETRLVVKRDWSAARAWLQGQLSKTPK
jgi:hypothetical protein